MEDGKQEKGRKPRRRSGEGISPLSPEADFVLGRTKALRRRWLVECVSPWTRIELAYDSKAAARHGLADLKSRKFGFGGSPDDGWLQTTFTALGRRTVEAVVFKRKRRHRGPRLVQVPLEDVPMVALFDHSFPGHEAHSRMYT